MLDGLVELETPLTVASLVVWQLPERPAQRSRRDWRMSVRLGPDARGALANKMETLPLAARRGRAREILEVLIPPAQVGYPANMDTGARLEYSAKVYHSAELAFESCDAQRSVPVRVGGKRRGYA